MERAEKTIITKKAAVRSKVQVFFAVCGCICLAYFLAAAIYTGGTLDLGWIWAAGGLMLFAFGLMFSRNVSSPALIIVRRVILAVGAAGLILLAVLFFKIIAMMRQPQASSPKYAVVLGAQVKGTEASKSLRLRLDRAAEFARDNPGTVMILSGGRGPGEDITEAECMYSYLLDHGIDKSQLLMEDRSTSTYENLVFSDELTGCAQQKTGIITSDFHIYRAMKLAGRLGYKEVFPVPASSDTLLLPHFMLREAAAIIVTSLI